MHIPTLSSLNSSIKNIFTHESVVRSQHSRIVYFWMYVVCAALVSVVLVSLLSLYIWFVQPADTAADAVELLPEERKQVVEGEYDIAKAEEILKLFESRATSSR